MHMQRADDLFGMPNGNPITDRVIEASIQWAERIMERIDNLYSKQMRLQICLTPAAAGSKLAPFSTWLIPSPEASRRAGFRPPYSRATR
jgi:hypothetical protein